MGHFDKCKPGKITPSCDYFFPFSYRGTEILVRSFTCVFVADNNLVTFEWEKPNFIDF